MSRAEEVGGGVQDAVDLLLFVLPSSLKELEQVYCKFYNELGRVLVKDFVPVQQADELSAEPEDDIPSFVPQDMGKCSPRLSIFAHQAPFLCYFMFRASAESFCVPPESAVGAVEDRKKVPWSDKETIILLEIWGDTQVIKDFQGIGSP